MTRESRPSLASEHPGRARLAGVLLVLGMITFWAGAFAPVPVDYMAPVAEQFVSVADDPTMWLIANLLFVVGVGFTAAGVSVLSRLFETGRARQLASTGTVLNLLGAVVFVATAYYRVTLPGPAPTSGAVPALFEAAMGGWLYASFLVLTLASFASVGVALLAGSTMRRLGVYVVGLSVVELAIFVLLGDLPPLVFYLVTAPLGIWLVRQSSQVIRHADRPERGTPENA